MPRPSDIGLPPHPVEIAKDASRAIVQERRATERIVQLHCLAVEQSSSDEAIYRLQVGSTEFDISWEGAVAFRPAAPEQGGENAFWRGEVCEVDPTEGALYISTDGDQKPIRGPFLVKPYEYLQHLEALLKDPTLEAALARHLAAAAGLASGRDLAATLGMERLDPAWASSWGILWGPPGTGKTHNIGQAVARAIADPGERVLVVSTTNRATDEAALALGRAAIAVAPGSLSRRQLLRIGRGSNVARFREAGLLELVHDSESDFRQQLSQARKDHSQARTPEVRAICQARIRQLLVSIRDADDAFFDEAHRVIVSTAHKGLATLDSEQGLALARQGLAPFTTVIIDEAGLVSRAATAALSLLASRRVLLVGDPKQLSPISKIARLLRPEEKRWLAESGLAHLEHDQLPPGSAMLEVQHRMAPEIRDVVSEYQYGGQLDDSPEVAERARAFPVDPPLQDQPRAIWYVLDEDAKDLSHVRAERGSGNRSWERRITSSVLDTLFGSHPSLAQGEGLFISPFAAQARSIRQWLTGRGLENWTASTVHAQQGTEADCVVFDTVNAGSVAWAAGEWSRLINVGLSRARQVLIVLASRDEMREPFLSPLLETLQPRVLRRQGSRWEWRECPAQVEHQVASVRRREDPSCIGAQLEARKELRPLMSAEQQRLCGLQMDGKPRLVRGVAGSGKTLVLARWLAQTLDAAPKKSVWVVYANASLRGLIEQTVREALAPRKLESLSVEFHHIRDVLTQLLREVGVRMPRDAFDYDSLSAKYLAAIQNGHAQLTTRCDALFVDEAQDMGESTLRLLTRMVKQADASDANARQTIFFYDNAQNIYGRGTPSWAAMGLDMRGRSTVMKESFRSTLPVAEFALNVLYRLQDPTQDQDHKELVTRGLIERSDRSGRPWWRVHFNRVNGPTPEVRHYRRQDEEQAALARRVADWIGVQGVRPRDIKIIVNNMKKFGDGIVASVRGSTKTLGVRVEKVQSESFPDADDLLVVTTPHSFKGYDAEIVAIPHAEEFTANGKVLASNLYVAMTRARSLLHVSTSTTPATGASSDIARCLSDSFNDLLNGSGRLPTDSPSAFFEEVMSRIPAEHRDWLSAIWNEHGDSFHVDSMFDDDGMLIAEPLFWLKRGGVRLACFEQPPGPAEQRRLEDAGAVTLRLGEPLPE